MSQAFSILAILCNVLVLFFFFKNVRNFLLVLPFLPFAGRWIYYYIYPTQEDTYIYNYLEVFLAAFIFFYYRYKDRTYLYLLLYPLVTLPAYIFTKNINDFFTTTFFFFLIVSGAGVYAMFRLSMKKILEHSILDKLVLLWAILGVAFKAMSAAALGTPFLMTRTGNSVWASNHQAFIILLFLPFVSKRWIAIVACLSISLHFSRGVYLSLILMAIFYYFVASRKVAIKSFTTGLLILVISTGFIMVRMPDVWELGKEYFTVRLLYGGKAGNDESYLGKSNDISSEGVVEGFEKDDRMDIFEKAGQITQETYFLGIGLGRFRNGLEMVGFPPEYSNAHNVYLTLLSEGGLLFLLLFLGLLLHMIKMSWVYDRRVTVSLLLFCFYGFFSGQIYEEAFEKSGQDYFYFLFFLAYLNHLRMQGIQYIYNPKGVLEQRPILKQVKLLRG